MYIRRELIDVLRKAVRKYPVVAVTGPRQSGKTFLVKHAFPKRPYVNLEKGDVRQFALEDPQAFLKHYEGGILDEIQNVPELLSYIQVDVDQNIGRRGRYLLTGSQNLLLSEQVSQSLAGRIRLLNLLSCTWGELKKYDRPPKSLEHMLFQGGYPRPYDQKLDFTEWYSDYFETYVQRDVRSLKNVGNLNSFVRFVRMCAARNGQLLNLSSLGSDAGVRHNTARAWISVLEATYIVFLLPPHFKNFNKRLMKSPKLYFWDAGLLCYLLGIRRAEELRFHSMRGAIFEAFVISEIAKRTIHRGEKPDLYFWQDKSKLEVDLLIQSGERYTPVEIKSGQTVNPDFFRGLNQWSHLSGYTGSKYVVYGGEETQNRQGIQVASWRELSQVEMD